MPFIRSHVSIKTDAKQENILKKGLGKIIENVPGKNEMSLMLLFEDSCHLYFQGKNEEPIAYLEVAIFGNEAHFGYDDFVADVTNLYERILHIKKENIFIRFEDIPAWGEGGINFDRNRYR